MQRYFGTDGIRGRAGEKLCPELALRAAYGFAIQIASKGRRGKRRNRARIAVGCDSRLSSPMLTSAVNAGLTLAGCDVLDLGLVPTPVVPLEVLRVAAAGGVMVTASHNPVPDNGIKLFGSTGAKVSATCERAIERFIDEPGRRQAADVVHYGVVIPTDATDSYLAFTRRAIPARSGQPRLRIVLDCAHGATSFLARPAFEAAGHTVYTINADADGSRVNVRCGATDLSPVRRGVREHHADLGLAFDGDGDRVKAVDEKGHEASGDKIIALFATRLRRYRSQGAVVMTQMSNAGVEQALRERGVRMVRTDVGDIHVLAAMRRRRLNLGGEQSGHIIMRDKAPTGDGILAGLQLAQIMRTSGLPLSALLRGFNEYPQLLTNISVVDKEAWRGDKELLADLAAIRKRYAGVRLYIRPSGTEDVMRVLAEAQDPVQCQQAHGAACQAFQEWDRKAKCQHRNA